MNIERLKHNDGNSAMTNHNSRPNHSNLRVTGIALVLALFFFLLIAGCFHIPERPNWDMPFTIPFAERVYSLTDLIHITADSTNDTVLNALRRSDNNGFYGLHDTLVFYSSGAIKSQSFHDKLHSQSTVDKDFNYKIDTLHLDSLQCGSVSYTASTILGRTIPADTLVTIPSNQSFNNNLPYDTRGSNFVYFQYFDLASGSMFAEVKNNLSVPLYDVHFTLRDTTSAHNALGNTDTAAVIQPGAVDTLRFRFQTLSRVYNFMYVHSFATLHPSSSHWHNIDSLKVNLFTGRINITEAIAAFVGQHAHADTLLETGFNDRVYQAEVRNEARDTVHNRLRVTLSNRLAVAIDSLRVYFTDFRRNGAIVTQSYNNIPAHSSKDTILDMRGTLINLPVTPVDSAQHFHALGDAYTRSTNGAMALLKNTDSIDFIYHIDTLYFTRFQGIPDSINFDFDTTITRVTNRPNGVTDLGLVYAELVVSPTATVNYLPVVMDYHLVAYHDTVRRYYDTLNQYFPTINSLFRVGGTQNIINIIPDSIESFGKARLGRALPQMRNMGIIQVSETDTVAGYATLEGKMMFRLQSQSFTPDPERRDGQNRPISRIDFKISGENHLPIGGRVQVQLSSDSLNWVDIGGSIFHRPGTSIRNYRPFPLNSFTTFDTTIVIVDSNVNKFKQPVFYTRAVIHVDSTGADTVLCITSDYIKVRTGANITVNTGEIQ